MKVKTRTYQNLINGEWVSPQSGELKESVNPSDNRDIVGYVPVSTKSDVDDAVHAAKQAFQTWRKLPGTARGEYLRKAADILEQRVDDIAKTLTREMGKTLIEAKAETLRGVDILRYYVSEGIRSIGEVIPSGDSEALLFTSRVPVGVVGLITPWNFPVAIPVHKIAPALVYGNTVVIKSAFETTITAIKVMECFKDAGLPDGVLNLVSGRGSTIGNALCDHPDIKAISFTGSNDVGKLIALKAVQRGAKFQLEMGGKNPVIVTEHADLDLAAEMTVNGSMKSAGQKCTATSRAIIVKEVYEPFREKIIQKIKNITVGNALQTGSYMGPVSSLTQFNSVQEAIKKGVKEGARLVLGGNTVKNPKLAYGYYIEPTLFDEVESSMSIAQEEIFGPVLALIKVENLDEALQVANDVKYGLSASIFTNHLDEVFQYMNEVEAGMIRVNGETTGLEIHAPFGGIKDSSTQARELGRAAMEFFTSIKTITIKS
ncbi:alpha-ketoglutaric semialdehyde dehydrogenase GucD [Peribacillus sp. R9-11]|uniref:alpha-ketoglutaric semialdehyde dehydrogenase GucD n=1 Tax=Peribacillus sp. R9-11 TaxID=3073271 RepID=UPI002868C51B|nr:alpha-ketoglutaric semialdehyde dehydrogenase GucD [Peribacillus sp. R9-11]WMX58610.1 aldehyde dehydrogenase family protein [Peribacillus sp. R9-11]